jgi:hypothetical protein
MFSIQSLVIVASAALVLSSPLTRRAWPSGDVTCGKNVYTLADIKEAVSTGTDHLGSPIGDSEHLPCHRYINNSN